MSIKPYIIDNHIKILYIYIYIIFLISFKFSYISYKTNKSDYFNLFTMIVNKQE